MSAVNKILAAGEYVVELVKGINSHKQPFFAYLLLQKSNLAAFKTSLKTQNTDLKKFGVVLASGTGHEPTPDIWDFVQAKLKKQN